MRLGALLVWDSESSASHAAMQEDEGGHGGEDVVLLAGGEGEEEEGEERPRGAGGRFVRDSGEGETQIPFGNDNQKGNDRDRSFGALRLLRTDFWRDDLRAW